MIVEQNYHSPQPGSGGCTVMHLEEPTLHERCVCIGQDVSYCKSICDEDLRCKGYSETKDHHRSCAFATESKCPSDGKCKKYGLGQVGLLIRDGKYGAEHYDGCYIKGELKSSYLNYIRYIF